MVLYAKYVKVLVPFVIAFAGAARGRGDLIAPGAGHRELSNVSIAMGQARDCF
jgi:hypothetical protein